MCFLSYSKRLEVLKLYSLQRRRERYGIIYVWMIIKALVPNLSDLITCSFSDRRGRACVVCHSGAGRLGTLKYNSFRWRSIRMFNRLPKSICMLSSCSVVGFKSKLDSNPRIGMCTSTRWRVNYAILARPCFCARYKIDLGSFGRCHACAVCLIRSYI